MRTKVKKEVVEDGLFSLVIFSAGKESHLKAGSVLELLKNLPIEPLNIKNKTIMQFRHGQGKYQRMFNVAQLRRLIGNDTTKEITAKFINVALGING